ncbi:LigA [Burkholderia pseudomallei MSHR346]|nr:LigA [Burkholderia pseudomallei MSHR346]
MSARRRASRRVPAQVSLKGRGARHEPASPGAASARPGTAGSLDAISTGRRLAISLCTQPVRRVCERARCNEARRKATKGGERRRQVASGGERRRKAAGGEETRTERNAARRTHRVRRTRCRRNARG